METHRRHLRYKNYTESEDVEAGNLAKQDRTEKVNTVEI